MGHRWLASVVGLGLIASMVAVPVATTIGATPTGPDGRLAFTDGQDRIWSFDVNSEGVVGPEEVESIGAHSGQAGAENSPQGSSSGADGYAFVSTRPTGSTPAVEDPEGEVWYRFYDSSAEDTQYVQVTDDTSRKTHPQPWLVSRDCYYSGAEVQVAFASDRSGNWDIYVATLAAAAQGSGGCAPLELVGDIEQVTTDPGDDLWPAWALRGPNNTRSLVFSSTRSDPLGDLYAVDYPRARRRPVRP